MRKFLLCLVSGVIVLVGSARAEDWPGWRGPEMNGVASPGKYPVSWGPETNVAWKVPLAAPGGSTPAVWGDRIFLTAALGDKNGLLCLDRTGREQWRRELGALRPGRHRKASGCNPSPVTDGRLVFVYFKSGDLACLDFDGTIQWTKNLQKLYGEDTLWWDLGTSPVLTDRAVVVACIQSGLSYLVAMDKATGDVIWKQDRILDAPEESAQSYSTPLVLNRPGGQILVVLGADHVTGHDARTGRELWRVGGLNPRGERFFRSIASAVATGDMVIAPYARGETLTGIRLGGSGDVTETHVAWTRRGLGTDVPTPAARDGKVYLCTDGGEVVCLDAATGKSIWSEHLERNRNVYSSSPVLAGDHLYVTREDGKSTVLQIGPQGGEVVAENELGEFVLATPVLVDGMILIRTFDHLYAIGSNQFE